MEGIASEAFKNIKRYKVIKIISYPSLSTRDMKSSNDDSNTGNEGTSKIIELKKKCNNHHNKFLHSKVKIYFCHYLLMISQIP